MNTKVLVTQSLIISIIIIMSIIPNIGYISIGIANITLIHIPVIIIAGSSKNYRMPLSAGLAFGITSWLNAIFRPTTLVSVMFQNPLVSILPRVIFALFAFYLFNLLRKISFFNKNEIVVCSISSIIATLFHTILVIIFLFISDTNSIFNESLIILLKSIILSNGIFEVIMSVLIAPPIVLVLRKVVII